MPCWSHSLSGVTRFICAFCWGANPDGSTQRVLAIRARRLAPLRARDPVSRLRSDLGLAQARTLDRYIGLGPDLLESGLDRGGLLVFALTSEALRKPEKGPTVLG